MRANLIVLMFACTCTVSAQVIDFASTVSLSYNGESLEYALTDLAERYQLRFSYSPQMIPLQHEVFATVVDAPLTEALDALFTETAVIYGFIGNQLVLSIDPVRQEQLYAMHAFSEPVASLDMYPPRMEYRVAPIYGTDVNFRTSTSTLNSHVFSDRYIRYESDRLLAQAERDANVFRAQISLVPSVQAISLPGSYAPLNLSFNVLAGANDNLEGFELGTISNTLRGNMTGMQVSGVVNTVKMSSKGVQVAGVVNAVKEDAEGMQVAGVTNISGNGGDVIQVGGVLNVAELTLGQVAGAVNVGEVAQGAQISGAVNVASYAPVQITGGVNVADEAEGVQVAGLLNVAHRAGVQIGVFNVADTSRVSIGVLSFIKDGYRSLELSGEEMLHANLNFRLGMRTFYNILHVSSTYDASSWAFGYGVGTSFSIPGRGNYVQLELLSRHVSEDESWTDELNLHNQFNIIWDLRIGEKMSVAFGPTINAFVSKRYVEDTNQYGSQLPPYTILNETFNNHNNGPVNVKGWIGFHLGIRYNMTGSR